MVEYRQLTYDRIGKSWADGSSIGGLQQNNFNQHRLSADGILFPSLRQYLCVAHLYCRKKGSKAKGRMFLLFSKVQYVQGSDTTKAKCCAAACQQKNHSIPFRNGLCFFSWPMVVCGPCPEYTSVSSGNTNSCSLMLCNNCW